LTFCGRAGIAIPTLSGLAQKAADASFRTSCESASAPIILHRRAEVNRASDPLRLARAPRIFSVDDELLSIARASIGAEHELTVEQSARLRGQTAAELRDDAKAMRRELGIPSLDERPRDQGGRFAKTGGIYDKGSPNAEMNARIRAATGRTS
jgi:hypothetical protein